MCVVLDCFLFCKQKTAYDMRISYWSSDVCSSDLGSGKSSLLRCVNRLNEVSRGKVLVHDGQSEVDVASCDAGTLRRLRQRRISMEIGRASCRERVCPYG